MNNTVYKFFLVLRSLVAFWVNRVIHLFLLRFLKIDTKCSSGAKDALVNSLLGLRHFWVNCAIHLQVTCFDSNLLCGLSRACTSLVCDF